MKMYRLLFLVGVLVLGVLRAGHAQYATWSRPLAPAALSSRSVTDAAGNTYVAGSYRGALTMGATTLPAPTGTANATNTYLAKIDSQGLVQWAIAGASARADDVLALALAPNGNVHVAFRAGLDSLGQTQGINHPFAFGGQTLPTGGFMLATVSPTGTVGTLSYLNQGRSNAEITSMAVDAAGNTLLSAGANFNDSFAGYTFPSAGSSGFTYSSAIFRTSPNGTVALVRAVVATMHTSSGRILKIEDLAVDASGDIYCVGSLQGTAPLGGTPNVTLTQSGGVTAFGVKFSASGVAQWGVANKLTNGILNTYAVAFGVALAPSGEVYMAGHTGSNNIAFGGIPTGSGGGFVVKLSAAGIPQWVQAQTASRWDDQKQAAHLAVDAAGNVYKSGIFNLVSANFGNGIILANALPINSIFNPSGFYVVSYDPSGTTRWARAVDGQLRATPADSTSTQHFATGLGADASGNVYFLNYKAPNGARSARLLLNGQILSDGNTVVRLSPASRLSGTLYIDQNSNGARDAGEVPFPYPQILTDLTQTGTFSSAPGTGQYSFYGLPGTAYAVTVPSPHPYYTLQAPTLLTGTFPAAGQAVTGQD